MNQNQPNTLIPPSGIRRQAWMCSAAKQLVVFVRDASSSMNGQKAADAETAGIGLVADLAQPANKDGFLVSIVDFADTATVCQEPLPATALVEKVATMAPGGCTNVAAGLETSLSILARSEAEQQAGFTYLRPVVIAFSDGGHNTGPDPREVASRLKDRADVVMVAFGADADEALLRELATSPQHFYRCSDGRELRAFLAAVGPTLSVTMAARTAATKALTEIRPAAQ